LPGVVFGNFATVSKNTISLQVQNSAILEIYNLNGKPEKTLNFASGAHSVSLNGMPKGMYIVKASFGSEKQILRIVVQ